MVVQCRKLVHKGAGHTNKLSGDSGAIVEMIIGSHYHPKAAKTVGSSGVLELCRETEPNGREGEGGRGWRGGRCKRWREGGRERGGTERSIDFKELVRVIVEIVGLADACTFR